MRRSRKTSKLRVTGQPTAGCIAKFHQYCCYIKLGGITPNLTLQNHWGALPMCQNTTMRVNGAWIKRYCVLCSKTYHTLQSCHNFPAGSRQVARGACVWERSLFPTQRASNAENNQFDDVIMYERNSPVISGFPPRVLMYSL